MTYTLKSYEKNDDHYVPIGDLTKEIKLAGQFNGVNKDPRGNNAGAFHRRARSIARISA
jgi:hypothetical protein